MNMTLTLGKFAVRIWRYDREIGITLLADNGVVRLYLSPMDFESLKNVIDAYLVGGRFIPPDEHEIVTTETWTYYVSIHAMDKKFHGGVGGSNSDMCGLNLHLEDGHLVLSMRNTQLAMLSQLMGDPDFDMCKDHCPPGWLGYDKVKQEAITA